MDLNFNTWIIILVTFITLLLLYYDRKYQYWQRKNVPNFEASLWSNFKHYLETGNIFENLMISAKKHYAAAKQNKWKHVGVYSQSRPVYIPVNLDYIKNILTKDFQYFTDRGFFYNEKDDPLSAHLFAIGNPKWRSLRTKLTPTFTSGKMKNMFPVLAQCENSLFKAVDEKCGDSDAIDIKEILARFTTDVIGSCAFGLEFNTFQEENSPFRVYGKKIFDPATPKQVWTRRFCNMFPEVGRYLKMATTPQDVTDFFVKLVRDNVEHRDKKEVRRNDFMQLLIQLRDSGDFDGGKVLSVEEMAAQCFVFFIAGFETSSTTMSFALYQIAKNSELQQKLRQEVEEVVKRHEGELTYESSQDMKLLNQVIDETLRMYPPVPFLMRKCVKSYKLPDEDLTIDQGTSVFISSHGIHYDEEYYPNPQKFDPSRFSEQSKKSRHGYAFLPFGEGPRNCIGARFGLMQTRFGLASLLRKYRFTVNGKTKEPLKMRERSPILTAEGGIWLNAEKI